MLVRNELVWDKSDAQGMNLADRQQYATSTERCLFIQLGAHHFQINQTKDDYWPGWEPIRQYLLEQRDHAGFTPGRVNEICNNHMHGHWFGMSQWSIIPETHYTALRDASNGTAFTKPYAELRAEYQQLQAQFNGDVRAPERIEHLGTRPYFDNTHDNMCDVWQYPYVVGGERFGHATPKPVAMMERVMRSSARPGEICLEPFGGTGSTLIGAHRAGRTCYTMELNPEYVDIILHRWERYTGLIAERIP
ncbi:MAG: site-specific DNA-methyltransferase [Pleurocapsa sp. SU_196_0]|nr:site-specific DNA-methyltransferase [Pleurocapsa sp. SU_196_0]